MATATATKTLAEKLPLNAAAAGRFGVYGGRYVPETLMAALNELEREYERAKHDRKFQQRLDQLLKTYAGRPTPLFFARRLTAKLGGAKIYLKREDLLHTGAHKINNCLGQALLVERMGKRRVIAETGAGQHGVATATVCALLGFECVVYMGTEDMRRQELNVFRMRLLGAEVRGVDSGSRTLKDAINEAMRDWVTNVRTTHYLLGSVLGAHPYPTMVRDFHRVIGREARVQIRRAEGKLPKAIIACVGGGSNSIGILSKPEVGVRRWASMRRVFAAVRLVFCRELIPTCCRMRQARSRPRIRCPPVWTIRRSAQSTLCSKIRVAPNMFLHPMLRRLMPPWCSLEPKALFRRWNPRMPWPKSSRGLPK